MNFKEQLDQIERQIQLLCDEKKIQRDNVYYYEKWTEGEQYVLMKLFEARFKIAREEMMYGLKGITKVVLLSDYRNKKT